MLLPISLCICFNLFVSLPQQFTPPGQTDLVFRAPWSWYVRLSFSANLHSILHGTQTLLATYTPKHMIPTCKQH